MCAHVCVVCLFGLCVWVWGSGVFWCVNYVHVRAHVCYVYVCVLDMWVHL